VKLNSFSGLMCDMQNLKINEMPLEAEKRVLNSLKPYRRRNLKELLMLGWRPAFSLMVIIIILVTGTFDRANQSRITAMVEGPNAGMMPSTTCEADILSNNYEIDRLLAQAAVEYGLADDIDGGGTL